MFDPNDFIDPSKVLEAMEKMKDAMRAAADADTGAAKPLFEELYRDFSEKMDNPSAEENQAEAVKGFLKSAALMSKLAQEAKNNPAAKEAMDSITQASKEAFSSIFDIKSIFNKLGNFDASSIDLGKISEKFSGFGKKSDDAANDDVSNGVSGDGPKPKKPEAKKPGKGPKKPGGGDFKV